jgi:hypothetical protein
MAFLCGNDLKLIVTMLASSLNILTPVELSLLTLDDMCVNYISIKLLDKAKSIKPGMVVHTCNPSTGEAKTGGS